MFAEYLRRVNTGESVQDFFGDWCAFEGHSDVGYYLGAVLCRKLLKKMSLPELCNASSESILKAMGELS